MESRKERLVAVTNEGGNLRSAEEYRESLRDGRRVFYRGERVEDVTSHEVIRHAVEHAALDYRLAHEPAYRDLAVTSDGYSRYFSIPRSAEDLLARSALIEAATRAGKTLVVLIKEIGTDALFSLLTLPEELGEPFCLAHTDVLRALPGSRSRGLCRPDRFQGRSLASAFEAAERGRVPAPRRDARGRDRRSRSEGAHIRLGQRERDDRAADARNGPR
jgi:4-hydroxyphenylacetate 3-hydroxylase-like protein